MCLGQEDPGTSREDHSRRPQKWPLEGLEPRAQVGVSPSVDGGPSAGTRKQPPWLLRFQPSRPVNKTMSVSICVVPRKGVTSTEPGETELAPHRHGTGGVFRGGPEQMSIACQEDQELFGHTVMSR